MKNFTSGKKGDRDERPRQATRPGTAHWGISFTEFSPAALTPA
jgi:hypothetical protein